MRALVTGATGFIGSHLVEGLIKKGYSVTCLVRDPSNLRWLEGLDVTVRQGDCTDEQSLESLPTVEYVFHLAGLTKAKRNKDFFLVNATGTENLLRATTAKNPGLKRFIYLSSLAAAGPSSDGIPLNEQAKPHPVSNYGRSKLKGEEAATHYRDHLPVTIIRPPAVYGPRDRDFYVFFRMIKKGFYPYWGKCYYSLLYVGDLIRGIVMSAESDHAAGKVYYLANGKIYTNEEIVHEIAEALDCKVKKVGIPGPVMSFIMNVAGRLGSGVSIINSDKLRELKHPHWVCDSRKAADDFQFVPEVTLTEGMQWTAEWYRVHQWL